MSAGKPGDLSRKQQDLRATTAERLEAIVEAAERAAEGVIDDAEAQARRYLAQALDLTAADHGPIAEADVRFLERARFMYEEVERALSALRHAVETGDLALEGLRRD